MNRQQDQRDIPATTGAGIGKAVSFQLFNRIYKRYDLLNRLFSFGRDISWRNKLAKQVSNRDNLHLLDLATGTGDVALTLLKRKPGIALACGSDMARNMLLHAGNKSSKQKCSHRFSLIQADAASIPFDCDAFHVATMAFGIRNVVDPSKVLNEIRRVLKNEGKTLILEFSLPSNRILRSLHLFYLRRIIPPLGSLISGDKQAYRYLDETIETFPYGRDFCRLMENAGFKNVRFTPLTFGVATLYQGEK
jgi:demethylmenaquinone methyltransferase/2-methoxy-6-polyprenyl-1,4-benzoquinol methylase